MEPSKTITSDLLTSEIEYAASRSSGPGGQNVNKVNTKVTLRWNVAKSTVLSPQQKELLLQKLAPQLTSDGSLLIVAQDKRSQLQNKEETLRKLNQLLKKSFAQKKKRKPTKPSKTAIKSRLDQKKIHSKKKKGRQNRGE